MSLDFDLALIGFPNGNETDLFDWDGSLRSVPNLLLLVEKGSYLDVLKARTSSEKLLTPLISLSSVKSKGREDKIRLSGSPILTRR
jgi:hypothetical protein